MTSFAASSSNRSRWRSMSRRTYAVKVYYTASCVSVVTVEDADSEADALEKAEDQVKENTEGAEVHASEIEDVLPGDDEDDEDDEAEEGA